MLVGFNYPQYGNYYGRWLGPFTGVSATDTSQLNPIWNSSLPANLARLARMKVQVVRMFIMGNCLNYGPAPFKRDDVWCFNPPKYLDDPAYAHDTDGKPRKFSIHYTRLLQCFKDAGLKLIPSIIDFQAFLDPIPAEEHPGWSLARGRADIVEDIDKRNIFFKFVLEQFIDLSIPYSGQIYAIEIMNEPTWNIRTIKTPNTVPMYGNRIIKERIMSEFLAEACKMIEDAGFNSTVGHRFYEDCTKLPTGTIAQFHYYPRPDYLMNTHGITIEPIVVPHQVVAQFVPDPLAIPDHDSALREIQVAQLKIRPGWGHVVRHVFVGEFASIVDNENGSWPELNKIDQSKNIVEVRLGHLFNKGYPLALMWPHKAGSPNDSLEAKMDSDQWNSVARFAARMSGT